MLASNLTLELRAMSNSTRIACNVALAISIFALSTKSANAQQITAAQLFPKSTVLYTEIADPPKLIELLLNHPLRSKIEQVPAFRKVIKSEGISSATSATMEKFKGES